MADATAGIGDQVKEAWNLVKPNLVTWIIALIVGGLLSAFTLYLLLGPMQAGWTIMALKSKRGEKIEIGDLFKGFERFVDYLVIGLVGIIVPFGFLITTWALPYCVDKKAPFMDSLKWGLAFFLKDIVGCIVAFVVAFVLILVGEIACGIGVLVTAPIAIVYLNLFYLANEGKVPAGSEPALPKT